MARMRGLIVVLAALMGGCGASRSHEYAFDIAPTTGMLAVDVENFRGSVEVRADDRLDEARVEATSHAGLLTGDQAEAMVAGMDVHAELVEEGARAVLRVRSESDREDAGDHWVNIRVRVPRCEGVRIENRGGTVLVVGTGGGTMITNREGAIEFRTDQAMLDPVTLTTTDGNVYYQVPIGSKGRFDLETLSGSVWYRDSVAGTDETYSAPRLYQARLNEGENPVLARTSRGDISVWVNEDPVGLTRVYKKSLPDPRDQLYLQGSRRYTRNLPDDHAEVRDAPMGRGYDTGY